MTNIEVYSFHVTESCQIGRIHNKKYLKLMSTIKLFIHRQKLQRGKVGISFLYNSIEILLVTF